MKAGEYYIKLLMERGFSKEIAEKCAKDETRQIQFAEKYHNQKMEEIMPELFDWIIIFVQKARVVDDPRLDRLFELDDLYQKVYSDNRIRHDFFIAAQMAYMAVFNEIFKTLLTQEEK